MVQIARRNRLMPWYTGLGLVVAAIAYIGYEMVATGCAAPTPIKLMVLLGVPVVYLVLMYLTFTSQD